MKIIVIGAGPAGEAAARSAAKQKAKVLLIEREKAGGLCLNRGCIPSKTLLSFGKKLHDIKSSKILERLLTVNADYFKGSFWKEVQEQKKTVIENLRSGLEKTIQLSGTEIISGEAKFIAPDRLQIIGGPSVAPTPQERVESFDRCIIAVGSSVFFPKPLDQYKEKLLDSSKALNLDKIPQSLLVVGGGAIGCEFSCLFNELGSKVHIVEKMGNLLPGEDEQVASVLKNSFEKRGIRISVESTVLHIEPAGAKWKVNLSNKDDPVVDEILVCAGRRPNLQELGLEKAGVSYSSSGIKVNNENLQTSNSHIYAIGDVNGLSLLAHAGSAQGEVAAGHALGEKKIYENHLVPRCLYTWPEAASVGMNKKEAESIGKEVKAQRFFLKASGKALAEGDSEGFIQVVSDVVSGRILGAQMVGPHATELIHIVSVALKKEMSRDELRDVIFAHPTFSEGIRSALER